MLSIALGPLPRHKSRCSICPAKRSDPYLTRFRSRAFLLQLLLLRLVNNRFSRIPTNIFIVAFALLIETFYPFYFRYFTDMNGKTIILALAVIALVAFPYFILYHNQALFNPLVGALLDVLLALTSVALGVCYSIKKARREGTSKWLPAAEAACNNLLTISYDAERMRRKQNRWCSKASPILGSLSGEDKIKIEFCFSTQCEEIAEDLASIRAYIDNAYEQWKSFIRENCDDGECEIINANLEFRTVTLKASLEVPRAENCENPDKKEGA